jgi:hypothetical protein
VELQIIILLITIWRRVETTENIRPSKVQNKVDSVQFVRYIPQATFEECCPTYMNIEDVLKDP